jgi:hypothetical protein
MRNCQKHAKTTPPETPHMLRICAVPLCPGHRQSAAEVAEGGHSECTQGAEQEPVEGLKLHTERVNNQRQPAK